MNKQELLNEISNSKQLLKNHIRQNKIEKENIAEIVYKILENESKETQQIINLHYMDWYTTEEISSIIEKTENEILYHFQLILFKIKLVLKPENDNIWPYSVASYSWKNKSKYGAEKKWSLLDKKS